MPIGVPKVAYRLPGEAVPHGSIYIIDYIVNVFYFLVQHLMMNLKPVNGIMLYLSAEDSNRRLVL